MDGDKRIAFAVANTFLVIDGRRITADADATYRFIIRVYETGAFPRVAAGLRANVTS